MILPKIRSWLLAAAVLPAVAFAAPVHVVLVGDSTVAEKGGWGGGLVQGIDPAQIKLSNVSRTGRSSKSFRDEGLWDKTLKLKADYYVIQFGHNDEGDRPERATSLEEYEVNLSRYVDDVHTAGAKVVLVTPLARRQFKDKKNPNKITCTLSQRAEVMKKVAQAKQVPVIELHDLSRAIAEKLGPKGCEQINGARDDGKFDIQHLSPKGQVVFGRVMAHSLRQVAPELVKGINPDRIGAEAHP